MYEVIEGIIRDEIKLIRADQHRRGGGTDAYDIGHYQGVIDGQIKAYEKMLAEIQVERQKV